MRHRLVWSWEVKDQVPEGGVTDDSILDLLESGTVGAVPGEVCVLLEQLMQRGSQGGQAWDEGTEVCYHVLEFLEFSDVCWYW